MEDTTKTPRTSATSGAGPLQASARLGQSAGELRMVGQRSLVLHTGTILMELLVKWVALTLTLTLTLTLILTQAPTSWSY